MEQQDSNQPVLTTIVDETPVVSLGRTLREARERLGMSVDEVANQVKFAPRQVQALEADDFAHLPEIAFVRGFVRSYAKVLGLDVQPLLILLPGTQVVAEKIEPASVEAPFSEALTLRQHNMLWLGAALLVALFAAGFAIWQSATPSVSPESVTPQESATVNKNAVETTLNLPPQVELMSASAAGVAGTAASDVASAADSVSMQLTTQLAQSSVVETAPLTGSSGALRLVFDEESWTEIRDHEGKLLSSQVNLAGSELRVDGVSPFSFVIGHASKVHLYRGGKMLDLSSYINTNSDVARLTVE